MIKFPGYQLGEQVYDSAHSLVFRCRREGVTVYLRLTPMSWRGVDEIAAELRFMACARGSGLAVPSPLPDRTGSVISRVGGDGGGERLAGVLFEAAPGKKQFLTIAGAGHNDPWNDEFHESLHAFLGFVAASQQVLQTSKNRR